MAILVTGGAGYIGTHTCVDLLIAGYDIVVVDNFYNSKPNALKRVEAITGRSFPVYDLDILDVKGLGRVFREICIDAVIHFAGFKAVGESVMEPMKYYRNNVAGTVALVETMARYGVKRMVFSSSAAVYGTPKTVPIAEHIDLNATNPYGRTKLMIEDILRDLCVSDPKWQVILLRYFNPIGAHDSGLIGEDPNGIPNNLVPFITQVAVGKREKLSVFGDDYDTHDGTGVRDYIHIVDLARGHQKALERALDVNGIEAYNLGTGVGYSVLDVVKSFEDASGVKIPYQIVDRRAGDVAKCYADPSMAREKLGWVAEKGLTEMCRDSWRWQVNNPNGYEEGIVPVEPN